MFAAGLLVRIQVMVALIDQHHSAVTAGTWKAVPHAGQAAGIQNVRIQDCGTRSGDPDDA